MVSDNGNLLLYVICFFFFFSGILRWFSLGCDLFLQKCWQMNRFLGCNPPPAEELQ